MPSILAHSCRAQMESERQTRKHRIDPLLKSLGWTIAPFDPERPLAGYEKCAIEEYPTENGPADYALCLNGQIVAVVEAKKVTLGPQNVLTQAERYSRGLSMSRLNFDGFRAPFLYSTNGAVIWFHDVRHTLSRSRKINQFHTPAALREMLERNLEDCCDWFQSNPNTHHRLRPYQIEANDAIENAIADRKRQMLVAMATGTGKNVHFGESSLSPDEIRRWSADSLPGRPPCAGRTSRSCIRFVRTRAGTEIRQDLRSL
jgi:type I restriction enzyme, R subunit